MATAASTSSSLPMINTENDVPCLAIGKSGTVIATGGRDLNLWRLDEAKSRFSNVACVPGTSKQIECLKIDNEEKTIVYGHQGGAMKLFDVESGKVKATYTGHASTISTVMFHPMGDFLLSGSKDKTLKLWDIRQKGSIKSYKGHTRTVNCLAVSPDGQLVSAGSDDGSVRSWDMLSEKVQQNFQHKGPVVAIQFHPEELLLVSSSSDR